MKHNRPPKIRRILLQIAVAVLSIQTLCATGQPPPTIDTKSPQFDVVSIRPNNSGSNGGAWGVTNNQYRARNVSLSRIILSAYLGVGAASDDRLKGAPTWVTTEPYDITAKADDATADSWKGLRQAKQIAIVAPMLRTMLEDRCKLVVHTVPTQLDGYTLVLSKHPLKIKEWQPDEPLPKSYGRFEGGWMITYSQPDDPFPSTTFLKITIPELIEFISGGGPPIADHTGLTGTYDIVLPRIWSPPPPPPEGSAAPPQPMSAPDSAHIFDWASVGLEMKPMKVPGLNIVIDHIERPTPN
jgi:uncharacterized protein (TIGR03435 family)